MVCIVIRLGLSELNAEELAKYLSSIENDQPIYSITGLNAHQIAEEVDLLFTGERSTFQRYFFTIKYACSNSSNGYILLCVHRVRL
jgi:hypothetical protein